MIDLKRVIGIGSDIPGFGVKFAGVLKDCYTLEGSKNIDVFHVRESLVDFCEHIVPGFQRDLDHQEIIDDSGNILDFPYIVDLIDQTLATNRYFWSMFTEKYIKTNQRDMFIFYGLKKKEDLFSLKACDGYNVFVGTTKPEIEYDLVLQINREPTINDIQFILNQTMDRFDEYYGRIYDQMQIISS